MSHSRAIFLDRDGVLNATFVRGGVPHPPRVPAEVEILPGVSEAMARLKRLGFLLVGVTNQPDVARGTQSAAGVEAINRVLEAALPLDEVRVCCHDTTDGCECRKPKPGMILAAVSARGIDLSRSYLVGDRWSDIAAGTAAGVGTFLIARPYSQGEKCRPDYLVRDLAEAAEIIERLGNEEEGEE